VSEAVGRYIAGLVLCALVALAYAATRKRGLRAVLIDSVFCFGCMMAVVGAVAAVVHVLCALK
jgi:hypothetical protein